MTEHFTFSDSHPSGLLHAFEHTLRLRRAGFKTRLATRRLFTFPNGAPGLVYTVIARPPERPNRKARGCNLPRPEAPYNT